MWEAILQQFPRYAILATLFAVVVMIVLGVSAVITGRAVGFPRTDVGSTASVSSGVTWVSGVAERGDCVTPDLGEGSVVGRGVGDRRLSTAIRKTLPSS